MYKYLFVIFSLFVSNLYADSYSKLDRIIFDVTLDSWHNAPDFVDIDLTRSIGFNIAWGGDYAIKHSRYFSYFIGLGYSVRNIHHNVDFSENSVVLNQDDFTDFTRLHSGFDRNRMTFRSLNLPIEIRFRTPTRFPFRTFLCIRPGYNILVQNKIESNERSFVVKDFNHANRWNADATIRLGYGMFNLVGSYGLIPIFKADRGPQIHNWSIGVSLLLN